VPPLPALDGGHLISMIFRGLLRFRLVTLSSGGAQLFFRASLNPLRRVKSSFETSSPHHMVSVSPLLERRNRGGSGPLQQGANDFTAAELSGRRPGFCLRSSREPPTCKNIRRRDNAPRSNVHSSKFSPARWLATSLATEVRDLILGRAGISQDSAPSDVIPPEPPELLPTIGIASPPLAGRQENHGLRRSRSIGFARPD